MTFATTTEVTSNIVILSLTVNEIGNHRKVEAGDTDTSVVNITKKLMESKEFDAVKSLGGEIRRYVMSLSLPSPFKNGTYSMPKGLLLKVQEQLKAYRAKQSELVEVLCDALPRIRMEMEEKQSAARIGHQVVNIFKAEDFPTSDRIRASFDVKWGWVQLSTPDSLAQLDEQLFAEEQKKIQEQWEETFADMQDMLRLEMLELTNAMKDRLTDEGGKKKIFRDTLVTNFTEFLSTFDARNITNNAELKQLAQKAKQMLAGVDADDLRKSRSLRKQMQQNFSAMNAALSTMVIDRPKRGIEFGD